MQIKNLQRSLLGLTPGIIKMGSPHDYRRCFDGVQKAPEHQGDSTGAGYIGRAVRKCLITHGEIETAMTRRIGALLQEGRSQKGDLRMLGISSSCVNANSPYERGIQIESSQTVKYPRTP